MFRETHTIDDSPHKMHVRSVSRRHVDGLSSKLTELRIYSTELPAEGYPDRAWTELEDGAMTVWHYHFDGWPDHGVPLATSQESLRALVMEVGRHRDELGGMDECEVWVHWSVIKSSAKSCLIAFSIVPPA